MITTEEEIASRRLSKLSNRGEESSKRDSKCGSYQRSQNNSRLKNRDTSDEKSAFSKNNRKSKIYNQKLCLFGQKMS